MTDRQTLQVCYQLCKNKVETLQREIHQMRESRVDEQFLRLRSSKKSYQQSQGGQGGRGGGGRGKGGRSGTINRNGIRIRRRLTGHYGKIYALQWCGSDETSIVSASQDGKLMIWNAHTENKIVAIPLRSAWVMTCCYSPSGSYVACGGLDNTCSVYKINENTQGWENGPPHRELQKHEGYIACCRFLDETHLISASGDSTLLLWDIVKQEPIMSFVDHTGDVMGVCVSPKQKHMLCSVSVDETAKIWDLRVAANIQSNTNLMHGSNDHNNNNNSVRTSNNNSNNINSNSNKNNINNPNDNSRRSKPRNQCVGSFMGHASDVNCCDWFPDGFAFATGSDDATIRLFDTRAYRQLNVYKNDNITCGVTSVRFSNSGKYLFGGYDERPFMIGWNTLSADFAQDFGYNLQHRVSCLDVNATGRAVATGSWDCNVRIWS